ncbi:MAG TPA: cytochrome c peroxidase [Chitinophagaceae bacterium]|nr:cytochrome c peroxidase [Chitinophagaceae bacterium]
MKTNILLLAFVTSSCLLFTQCNKSNKTKSSNSPVLPATVSDYNVVLPLDALNNTPGDNAITDHGATLGRVLFYDKKLSINNQTACGSCHFQSQAFADPVNLSTGFEGKKTSRNSMAIVNAISSGGYFWDHRTTALEDMVLQPIKHQVEMGMEKIDILPKKIATIDYYPQLFKNAFGSEEITKEKISKAMAQFLRSMVAYNSKADETNLMNGGGFGMGWGQTTDPRVTQAEKHGAQLFQEKGCTNCHSGSNLRGWNENDFANIGLEMEYKDKGLGENDASQEGIFKVPSLRNVALTAPYMHDGRFATLKDVLNHYNSNVVDHKNLDTRLKENPWSGGSVNPPRKLNLTNGDINDIVAFLTTLTDENLIHNPKFSDPFQN